MTLKINQLRDCRSVFTAVAAAFVFSAGPGTLASDKADVIYPQMDEVVVQATSGEVLAFGPFRSRGSRRVTLASEHAVQADNVEDANFTDITDQIHAELGTEFGMRYVLHGPPHQSTRVKAVITFPGDGIVIRGGQRYRQSTERFTVKYNRPSLYGYGFDEPGEMVPGEWTFEIYTRGRLVVRRSFHVRLRQSGGLNRLRMDPD